MFRPELLAQLYRDHESVANRAGEAYAAMMWDLPGLKDTKQAEDKSEKDNKNTEGINEGEMVDDDFNPGDEVDYEYRKRHEEEKIGEVLDSVTYKPKDIAGPNSAFEDVTDDEQRAEKPVKPAEQDKVCEIIEEDDNRRRTEIQIGQYMQQRNQG